MIDRPSPPTPEAEEIVKALRGGDVDALVVHAADGERVFTLAGFNTYTELSDVVEAIRQGEVDAFVVQEGGVERVLTLTDIGPAMREGFDTFRQMAESMPCIVFTADAEGRTEYLNSAWRKFVGLSASESAEDGLLRAMDAQHRERFGTAWKECVAQGVPLELELPFQRGASHPPVWHLVRVVPMRDTHGKVLRWFGTCTDIDQMKRAQQEIARQRLILQETVQKRETELEESQRQLRLSERMAVLGTLAAGIVHDIGNLLLPMRAHLDRLQQHKLAGEMAEDVTALDVCTGYLSRIIQGLRMLSRDPFEMRNQVTDMSAWAAELMLLLPMAAPPPTRLVFDVASGLPRVRIASIALTQAVFNVVLNAAHALGGRSDGVVTVTAARGEKLPDQPDRVVIAISDNGGGMDEATRQHCLEPFFTTKSRTLSTGLGLALVNQIVQECGGEVRVESQLGRGTTISLHIEAATDGHHGAAVQS